MGMPTINDRDVQRLVELIQRRAIEVLALPDGEREDQYTAIHQSIVFAARSSGNSNGFAEWEGSSVRRVHTRDGQLSRCKGRFRGRHELSFCMPGRKSPKSFSGPMHEGWGRNSVRLATPVIHTSRPDAGSLMSSTQRLFRTHPRPSGLDRGALVSDGIPANTDEPHFYW